MTETSAMLEPDDALALWTWAWRELDSPRDPTWRSRAEVAAGLLDVLTFAACELSLAGRHEWVERLPEMLRMHRGWLMRETSPQDKCLEAVADLLHHGAPVTKAVKAMARDPDPRVRAVVASGLRVSDADARAVLETLTTDSNRHVRSTARRRLPATQPDTWWVGKFDSDPIPRLAEVDDDLLAALRTVALFADRATSEEQTAMLPQLVEALALLPSAILVELVRRFVAFDWLAPGYGPMLDELLRRPQGASALWDTLVARLDRPHDWAHHYLLLGQLCRGLGEEAVEQLCRGLLQCLVERRHSRRAGHMTMIVEGVLREHWPPSLPGALVLDAWQRLADDAPELAEHLLPLLCCDRVDLRPELSRLLPLAEGDDALIRALSSVAARLEPASRHAFVTRGLASQSDKVRALALRQLAVLPPDPTPGSSQAAFTRYFAEPALRRAITSDERLCEAFCPQLRRQLRAGALELSEVAATLQAVGRLWGGTDQAPRDDRSARLEHAMAWHEAATETGPPSDQEWATWRALRRQVLDDEPKVHTPRLFVVRPAGPLHPDDREVIDWVMARWRRTWATAPELTDLGGDHFREALGIHFGLDGIVDPYVLELLEEVLAAIEPLDDAVVEMIGRQVRQLRRTLAT